MSPPEQVSKMISGQKSSHSCRKFVLCHLAIVLISGLFSILVLAFKASTTASFRRFHPEGGDSPKLRPGDYFDMGQISMYPAYLFNDYADITLTGAGISLAISVGMVLLLIFVLRKSKALLLMKWQRFVLYLVLIGNICLSAVVFLLNAVNHFRSARFDAGYTSTARGATGYGIGAEYDGGRFSIGSWACQMSSYSYYEEPRDALATQCRDEAVALWGSLVMALSNAALVGLVWLDWRREKLLFRGFRSLWEENETYYI